MENPFETIYAKLINIKFVLLVITYLETTDSDRLKVYQLFIIEHGKAYLSFILKTNYSPNRPGELPITNIGISSNYSNLDHICWVETQRKTARHEIGLAIRIYYSKNKC